MQVPGPPYFLNLDMTQGKQYELNQLQAGQGTVKMDDPTGLLIPPGSGNFAGINSGTLVRLRMFWQGGNGYPSVSSPYFVPFSGFIERIPPAWDTGTYRGFTEATLVDGWAYCQAVLNSILRTEVLYDGPYAYWPLGDAQGATYASNIAPGNANAIVQVPSKYGAGTATAAFGADGSGDPRRLHRHPVVHGAVLCRGGGSGRDGVESRPHCRPCSPPGYSLYCQDPGFPAVRTGSRSKAGSSSPTRSVPGRDPVGHQGRPKARSWNRIVDTTGNLWLSTWDVNGNLVTTLVDDSGLTSGRPKFFMTWPSRGTAAINGWDAYVNGTLFASSASTPNLAPEFAWISARRPGGPVRDRRHVERQRRPHRDLPARPARRSGSPSHYYAGCDRAAAGTGRRAGWNGCSPRPGTRAGGSSSPPPPRTRTSRQR